MRSTATTLTLIACLWPGLTVADSWVSDLSERLSWRAMLTTEAVVGSNSGELQKWELRIEPELTADLGVLGNLTAIGRLRFDPADNLEPGKPRSSNDFRSPASRRAWLGGNADAELRELFVDREIGAAFLRLGKQQVVWGEADGLRVLDIVNPFELREFILPEFEHRRIPLWTAQLEVPIGPLLAQFLWIPDHSYDDVPRQGSTFAPTSPRFVPGVRPPENSSQVVVRPPNRPNDLFDDDDYGVRLTAFVGGWDVSFNYFYHYQDQAILYRTATAPDRITIAPEYRRTHVLGGTFSNAFGKFTLRGEVAYSSDRYFLTESDTDDGVLNTAELAYVLGFDYQPNADWFVSTQLFQSVLLNAAQGATRPEVDSTVSLLVEKEFRNDTFKASALLLQSVNDNDGLLQAELAYEWRSNVTLKIGLDVFYGSSSGVFGQFDRADRVSAGVEIGL